MGLADGIKGLIAPPPRLTQEQLKKARPEKHPDVTEVRNEDGTLLLTAPLILQGRGFMGWMAKKMKAPDTKSFELEPVGAFVWELCDGRNTFDAISRKLRERYKMNRLEADAALTAFLQMLGQRRLIALKMGKTK
ncbi:MAG: PqqD family protein [Fimbriimonas sp.]